MERQIHIWNALAVIVINLALAAFAWGRARQGLPPARPMRILQGIAHALLLLQVLLGIGLLFRGSMVSPVHPLLGILALLALLLPVIVPALRANRPLAAAVVPTAVTILAVLAYGIGGMR